MSRDSNDPKTPLWFRTLAWAGLMGLVIFDVVDRGHFDGFWAIVGTVIGVSWFAYYLWERR